MKLLGDPGGGLENELRDRIGFNGAPGSRFSFA